jgi:hypothetical protein
MNTQKSHYHQYYYGIQLAAANAIAACLDTNLSSDFDNFLNLTTQVLSVVIISLVFG